MKRLFFYLSAIVIVSCNSKSKVHIGSNCFVKYDSLFKIVDTTDLDILRGTDSGAIVVLDKATKDGLRGMMRFDDKNDLRFYTFLYDDHNNAGFFLKYDALGNKTRESTGEVVQWVFASPKDSTVNFTFLLCAIDRNYAGITIRSGKFIKENITLKESGFTKLICANIVFNKADLDSTKKIYITGRWQEKCSKQEQDFIDSTIAP